MPTRPAQIATVARTGRHDQQAAPPVVPRDAPNASTKTANLTLAAVAPICCSVVVGRSTSHDIASKQGRQLFRHRKSCAVTLGATINDTRDELPLHLYAGWHKPPISLSRLCYFRAPAPSHR